jgi:hypothetical protein
MCVWFEELNEMPVKKHRISESIKKYEVYFNNNAKCAHTLE